MLPCRLTVLGPPELHAPDGDPIRLRTRKHLGLLVYLAMEPSIPHRRDRLATLFWPDAALPEARHSLATAVSMLRGRLGVAALQTTRDTIRLVSGHVLHDAAALDGTEQETRELVIPGRFLEEFTIPDVPDFDLWVEAKHAELTPKIHRVLGWQISFHRQRGDVRRVEALALHLHRIDDVAEVGAKALMEAHAMSGDRIGALRAYEHWGRRLHVEMGATPSRAVEQLVDRLRRGGLDRPVIHPGLPTGSLPGTASGFVGRGDEFQQCHGAMEVVRAGVPRHVLVRGDSGIGKTTLVERFGSAMALTGVGVARVQSYAMERELPFGVVVSAVHQLLELPGATGTSPEHLAELAVLAPRVRQRFPHLPDPRPTGAGESARLLFTEALMALLTAVAETQPVILILDDIHLADLTSLAVLHLMLRRLEQVPVMVMCTVAPGAASDVPLTSLFLESPGHQHLLLDLAPLSPAEASTALDLLLTSSDPDPGPTVRRAILRTADGNPMALTLLVSDWRRRGAESLALTLGGMTATVPLPPKEAFRRLIDATLTALAPDARAVAELAALLGQRLNELSLYTLLDLPVSRAMLAMSQLTGQRILRDAGSHLEFTNELIRNQCYHAMAAPARRHLHSLVADRLLAQQHDEMSLHGLEIAWHLVRADRLLEAIPWLLSGGRMSIQRGAPHEADLALSTGLPALRDGARRTALLLFAEARQELGRWHDSLEILNQAEEDFSPDEEGLRQVMQTVARRWVGYLATPMVEESTERLLGIAENSVSGETRVRALAAIPYLLTQSRDAEKFHRLRECLDRVDLQPLTDYQRLHHMVADAWLHNEHANPAKARRILVEAVGIVDQTKSGSSVALRAIIGAGTMEMIDGKYDLAVPLISRAAAMAKKSDNTLQYGIACAALATCHGRLGDHNQQGAWATESLTCFNESDWTIAALSSTYELALSHVFLERYELAKDQVSALRARLTLPNCPQWAFQVCGLMMADILAMTGDHRQAVEEAYKATSDKNHNLSISDYVGIYSRWKAIAAVRRGTIEDAISDLNSLAQSIDSFHAKDRVELIASSVYLQRHLGQIPHPDLLNALAGGLAMLPQSINTVMRRLGITAWKSHPKWGVKP